MVDRNGNGIPDDQERRRSSRGSRSRGGSFNQKYRETAGGQNIWDSANSWNANSQRDARTPYAPTEDSNFWTDLGRSLGNFAGPVFGPGTQHGTGTGFGDYMFGSNPNNQPLAKNINRRSLKAGQVVNQQEDTPLPSFLSNLMEALGIVGDGGGMDRVSYDPLRNDARSRSTEYDARLNAMYNQLQGSIRDDGATIQGNYQGAIDQNATRSAEAQQQIQGASDAAQASNMQQLQALGLGEAAGNIVAKGQDLNTQTAGAVQDAAARGQISGDALQQNQQSAGAHNTSLVGAAGLEGNLQRARVQSELASLLAQYDMEEQQANQQVDQFNASQRNSSLGQAMSLAQQLYGSEIDQRDYRDQLAQMQYEMANQSQRPAGPDSATLQYLMQLLGEDVDPELLFKGYEALRPRS